MGNILLACNGGGEQRASLAPGMLAETEQLLRHRHRADDATVRRVLDYAAAVVEGGEGTCGGCGLVLQLLLVTPCGHLVCPECVPAACVGCPVCAAPFAPVAYTACARCEAAGTPGCDAAHEGRRPRSMGGVDAFVWLQPGFSLDWQAPHYIVHHTVHCMVRVAAAGPRPRLAPDWQETLHEEAARQLAQATHRQPAAEEEARLGRAGAPSSEAVRAANAPRGLATAPDGGVDVLAAPVTAGAPAILPAEGSSADGAPAAAAAGLDAAAASASVAAAAAAAAARATTKSVRWADGHAASSSDSRAAAASSSLSGTLPPPPPPPPVEAEGVVQRTGFDGGGGDGGDDLSFSKFRHIASRLQALLDTY